MSRRRALALALLVFLSAVAAPLSAAAAAQEIGPVTIDDPLDPKTKTPGRTATATPTATPAPETFETVSSARVRTQSKSVDLADPPKARLIDYAGSAGPTPAKLRRLPAESTTAVIASRHADTIDIEYALTNAGKFATVITDDVNHDGRTVGIPASVLESAVGKRPAVAFGVHEDGDTWASAVTYERRNGREYAMIDVPRFSTNTITWSGQFTIEANPATDGTQFTYDQSTAVGNYTINVTGSTTTEWDNESRSAVAASDSRHTDDGDFGAGTVSGAASVVGTGTAANVSIDTAPSPTTFSHTGGQQTYTVPDGVTSVTVTLWGAGTGTAGGYVEGDLSTTPGETLYVYVGGSNSGTSGGFNGGGDGATASQSQASATSEGGAGATGIRKGGTALADRKAVAGGAGGDGDGDNEGGGSINTGDGGQGGADTGEDGGDANVDNQGGAGGTQSSGGTSSGSGADGSLGAGGDGEGTSNDEIDQDAAAAASGGGGGGYYGGGGGDAGTSNSGDAYGAGGGGGSSYTGGLTSVVSNTRGGGNTGDGKAVIAPNPTDTGTYLSPNHSVKNADTGYVDLPTVDNASVTVTWETTDGSGWHTLNKTTGITTAGNQTATWAAETNTTIRVNVTVSDLAGETDVDLTDESVAGAGASPTVSPAGNLDPTSDTIRLTGAADENGDTPGDVTVTASDGSVATFTSLGTGTAEKSIDVTTSTTDLTIEFTEGQVDYELNFTERTQTVDPSISVNGNTTSHTGSLADGATQSLTTNTAWVRQGSNQVNVSVGDGTLSADAPTPSVDLYYTHDGEDKSDVSYTGEKWTESYNVSKTFAQDQGAADLTIPFAGSVARIRTLEKRVNGGASTAIDSGNYTLSGTTLTVDLGSVTSGDEVRVIVDGSKVNPNNATISVLDPTLLGDDLNTRIQIDSWNDDSYIGVGGTQDGSNIHYADSESWSSPADYTRIKAGGSQHLYLPNASASETFRAKTIPVSVSPETGDVDVTIDSVNDDEPVFSVDPGATVSNPVDYTFENAVAGTDYILYSTTEGAVRDSGTASSPLTLTDDDSAETLQFQVDDANLGGGTGGGGGGGGVSSTTTVVQTSVAGVPAWAVIAGLVLLVVGYVAFGRRRDSSREASGLRGRAVETTARVGRFAFTNRYAQAALVALGVLAFAQAGVLPPEFVQVLALLLVPFGVYLVMRRTGSFNPYVLGVVAAVSGLLAAETLSPGVLLGPLGENLNQFILPLGIGALYLTYQAIQAYRDVNRPAPLQVVAERARRGDGDD